MPHMVFIMLQLVCSCTRLVDSLLVVFISRICLCISSHIAKKLKQIVVLSSVSSRQARSLAEDAFFHPSIMSVSYYSFEHCFAVYSVCFQDLLILTLEINATTVLISGVVCTAFLSASFDTCPPSSCKRMEKAQARK